MSTPTQVEGLLLLLVRNMGVMVQPRRGQSQQDEHRAFVQSVLVLYPPAVAQAVGRVDLAVLVSCFRTLNQVCYASISRHPSTVILWSSSGYSTFGHGPSSNSFMFLRCIHCLATW